MDDLVECEVKINAQNGELKRRKLDVGEMGDLVRCFDDSKLIGFHSYF